MAKELGTLNTVNLCDIWTSEPGDFTPWLIEHLQELAEVIGIDTLEVRAREHRVGPYAADIFAQAENGDYVVIENQLGQTDHDHLGKAITYSSNLDAKIVIWIAGRFTEQHQRAIEWLNEHTGENGPSFYAVQVEVWKINDSLPAVRFNVVSRPAYDRDVRAAAQGELSPKRQLQLEFWELFATALRERNIHTARIPRARYWFDVSLGTSGIYLSCIFNTGLSEVGVNLYIRKNKYPTALQSFESQKPMIEKAFGRELAWLPGAGSVDKVVLFRKPVDMADKSRWPELAGEMVTCVATARQVLPPFIKDIQSEQASSEFFDEEHDEEND